MKSIFPVNEPNSNSTLAPETDGAPTSLMNFNLTVTASIT